MGLGEAAVREIRKDIVYVSITGFGETGPYARQRAYDPVIQALSGLADIQRDRDTGRPTDGANDYRRLHDRADRGAGYHRGTFCARANWSGQARAALDARYDDLLSVAEAMPSMTFVGDETDPSDGEMGPDLVFTTQGSLHHRGCAFG